MRKSVIPTDHYRTSDRQLTRDYAVPAAPDRTGLTRLKVTSAIAGGASGSAVLMLRKDTSPYFEATTLSVSLFVPSGDSAAANEELWAEWHSMGGRFVKVGRTAQAASGASRVATTTTIIPARSGSTPGGPVNVQPKKFNGTAFVDDGVPVPVYSWVKTASADPDDEDDDYLWIYIAQGVDGYWWFIGQDCRETTE